MSKSKEPFEFVRSWVEQRFIDGEMLGETERCEYRASFWEGSTEAGRDGRYVRALCGDVYYRDTGRFLNTASNVSYYTELKSAMRKRPNKIVRIDQ